MISYLEELESLKKENTYRHLRLTSTKGKKIIYNNKELINFSSNDYLGLSQANSIKREIVKSIKTNHISQCSSRLMSGNEPVFFDLERELAKHRETESSLIYPTGYMANLGAISALASKDFTILSDQLNHASIIDACTLSKSKIIKFTHNDIADLESKITSVRNKKIMIIFEGLYSMDGDFANLIEICELAKKYNSITALDDAHGDFIYGSDDNPFGGTAAYQKVSKLIDIHTSSMSKALGCFGGYVATSRSMADYLVNKSRAFIFSSALPSHLVYSCRIALQLALTGKYQKRLFSNISYLQKRLKEIEIYVNNYSPIIPIIIGDETKTLNISKFLMNEGIFILPIRYPTVDKGKARLRISLSALHSKTDIDMLVEKLSFILKHEIPI